MRCIEIRRLRLACVMILFGLAGCAGDIYVSDFCLRDSLIYPAPGDIDIDSETMDMIVVHNVRLECGCPDAPNWCEP